MLEILDMTCKGCGKTVKEDPRKDGVTIHEMPGGGLLLMSNDEPHKFTCPYCGKAFSVWYPGPATLDGGSVSIRINGNANGNIIIGGNNNVVTKR